MSELSIQRVTILGAGTVGAALAAHLTNLGFSVTLLDSTPALAAEGIEHVRPLLYVPERAAEIRTLGFEEGDSAISDADWIVESLQESLTVKQEIYARIVPFVRPDALVSTTGGSLPIEAIAESLPDGFARQIVSTHFTSPLAERRFVEVCPSPAMDPLRADAFATFLATRVAMRATRPRATPSSIAARYGYWCLLLGAHVGEKLRLSIEDVDAIAGPFLGRPEEGIFGTIDHIGLDEMRDVAANLRERTANERVARFFSLPSTFVGLLARGWTGDRAGRGFYRREGRERLSLDLSTMVYRQHRDPALPGLVRNDASSGPERIRAALRGRDEVGEFLREFLVPSLRYAEALRDATDLSPLDFDRILEWGFGWEMGPFRLLDQLGAGAVKYYEDGKVRNVVGGYDRIPTDASVIALEECPTIDISEHFTLHDLGDGVQALAIHGGVWTPRVVAALTHAVTGTALGRFVLTSAEEEFPKLDSAFVLDCLRMGDGVALEAYFQSLQLLGEALERKPCVAALRGRCTGPSLAIALSCPAIVAVADTEIGFDEARLGLLPTARALAIVRSLHGDSAKNLSEVAVTLTEGLVARNADLARQLGLIRSQDVTEYAPERLLTTAKRMALAVEPGSGLQIPEPEGPLVGLIDRGLSERRARGGLTDHDVAIGHRIRQVLARTSGYDETLERERRESVEMGAKALTLARIRHYIETGRTLRN